MHRTPQTIDEIDGLDVLRRCVDLLDLVDTKAGRLVQLLSTPLLPGGYAVERYTTATTTLTANGSGVADGPVTVVGDDPGYMWLIDRIGTFVNVGSYTSAVFTLGDYTRGRVLDVSRQVPDAADEHAAIVAGSGENLHVYASGMTAGAQLVVTVAYRLARAVVEG